MNLKSIIESTKSLSILFVEDEYTTRKYVKSILENIFLKVDCAEDGMLALNQYHNYFRQNLKHYDLILTDIGLPGMDGLELSKKILEENPEQKIIVITAYDERDNIQELNNLGIESFLPKPIEFEYFFEIIEQNTKPLYVSK